MKRLILASLLALQPAAMANPYIRTNCSNIGGIVYCNSNQGGFNGTINNVGGFLYSDGYVGGRKTRCEGQPFGVDYTFKCN